MATNFGVGVKTLIRNNQNQYLLVLSHDRGWEIPGGGVEEQENLIEALRREVMEETGVTIRNEKLTGVYTNHAPPKRLILWFVSEYESGIPRISSETREVVWVEADKVLERITNESFHLRARDALEFDGEVVYRAFISETLREVDPDYKTLFEVKI